MWAALPLLALQPAWPAQWTPSGRAVEWDVGRAFFAVPDAHRLVVWPRLMCVLLGVAMVLLAYRVAASAGGALAGVVAAWLVAFEPNLLTASSIVYTDFGVALAACALLALCARTARGASAREAAVLGALFGVAIACKFTALLLAPFVAVAWWRGARRPGAAVALLGATFVTLWACYGFEVGPLFQAQGADAAYASVDRLLGHGPLRPFASAIGGAHVPMPAFWRGISYVMVHGRLGHRAFLAGAYSQDGFLAYFPVTILVRTALPVLLLAVLGALSFAWRRMRAVEGWLLAGAAWILVTAMLGPIDIGYRHILLVVPALLVLGARVVAAPDDGTHLAAFARRTATARLALAAGCVFWSALDAAALGPHHHAFFNALAGGPRDGYRLLLDSNLDLGQDLPDLAAYQRRQHLGEIAFAYFGEADPAAYGVRARPFTADEEHAEHPGVYAISVNTLFNLDRADDPARYAWTCARQPAASSATRFGSTS